MTQSFCTLFNSLYLDKGLTLYDSLCEVSKDFRLYILCMDEKCYEILTSLSYEYIIPIRLSDFENEDLLRVKKERTAGEYCWTCSSSLVKYVLERYNPEYCAYIDADLYFYSDPICIIEEMERRGASVQITGHRFYDDVAEQMSWRVGKYCVEYNTFKNDEKGRELLNIWVNQCMDYCAIDGDGIHWADQKYMDNWISDYPFAIETEHMGAGVAPWNIAKYQLKGKNGQYGIDVICDGVVTPVLFYHFQSIQYISRKIVRLNAYGRKGVQKDLVEILYRPYLMHIDRNNQMLKERFSLDILIKLHPGVKHNPIVKMWSVIKMLFEFIAYPNGKGNNISDLKANKLNIMTLE